MKRKKAITILMAIFSIILMLTACTDRKAIYDDKFTSDGFLLRTSQHGTVDIIRLIPAKEKEGAQVYITVFPKKFNAYELEGVYISKNITEWNQKTKMFWEGGYPVDWEKIKFTDDFMNVFWNETPPEWLTSGKRYLPGQIACPKIFRESYPDNYEPQRAMTFHYNYENAPNQGVFWYFPFFNDEDAVIGFENIPNPPPRYGYEFKGWFDSPDCENNGIKIPTENAFELQFYAKWETKEENK